MKIYPSKIGLELVLPIGALFLWIFYQMYTDKMWFGIIIMVLTSIFLGYLFLSIKYGIKDKDLYIFGCFGGHLKISIADIIKISETFNPLSAAATSVDRLEITYNKYDSILISPKNKKEFIAHLLRINETIEICYRKK